MITQEKVAITIADLLLEEYEQFLSEKARGTREAYLHTVRHVIGWLALCSDTDGRFQPVQLTQEAILLYLDSLEQEGLSLNHRARVKSTISNFAQFLIEEKGQLQRNPTRGIDLLPEHPLLPASLSDEQRSTLRSLVKQQGNIRGAALFALVYWAGCRVSEISWLRTDDAHVGSKVGWLHV